MTTRLRFLAALSLLACSLSVRSAQRLAMDEGVFFEAEDYDQLLFGEGFGVPLAERGRSGDKVLMGMWREGAALYRIPIPQAGIYAIWLRYAAPADGTMLVGPGSTDPADFVAVDFAKTHDDLAAPHAYRWLLLAERDLPAGEFLYAQGKGALRPDCFLVTRGAKVEDTPDFWQRVERAREAPTGPVLPELVHSRRITAHPRWLRQALRPCYAHFEWDSSVTADEWCRMARDNGANCIIGAGEMPAGTLDGKLKAYGYRMLAQNPDFAFPPAYKANDFGWAREMTEAAHANGLRIAIYGGAFRTLDPLLVEHPQWRQRDAAGKVFPNGFGSWHSPYREAYIARWVDVAKEARFDGIMIDMLFTGPTGGDYSSWTVDAFRERFGVEPPRSADARNPVWQRWLDFQSWSREEMLLDLTEALHAVDPEIAVIINQTEGWIFGQGTNNFLTTRVAGCVDGLLEEMGWEFRHAWNRPWAWPLQFAWQNLFLRCRTRDGYGQMWHVTFNYPAVHAEAASYAMLANGVAPAMVTGGNWPVMKEIWNHTRECEAYCEDAELVPWLALHFSEDTLSWYAHAQGADGAHAYIQNVFGWFQAALEAHLPVEIVTDDDLDSAALARYRVLLLPNSACLSAARAEHIAAFVAAGGGLVATYESGAFDENGTRREIPVLAGLLGAVPGRPVLSENWTLPLAEATHPILDHPDILGAGDWRQGHAKPAPQAPLFRGPKGREVGAVPVSDLATDAASIPLGGAPPPPRELTGRPRGAMRLLVARASGQGRTVHLPLDLGRLYFLFNHPVNRRIMERSLLWSASSPPPLRTDALMKVQTVPYRKGAASVVHLLNDMSSFGRAAAPNPEAFTAFRCEVAPVHDTTVAVPGAFAAARLLPGGTALPVRHADGFTHAVVPRIDIHAVVVFE